MRHAIVECVPNFSEGRDHDVVDAIVQAVARTPRVAVLDHTMDPDHHRSVVTFAGAPDAVTQAAVAAVACAVERIDLNRHAGVHPRIGAADVVPFVPVEGVTLADCVRLAETAAAEIWERLHVPVYFYEAAARRPERRHLENIRRGGFERLRADVLARPDRRPDLGGPELHPTAGAAVVGARKFLIAWNVNLATSDLTVAQDIARAIRASSGGLPHVKALGLPLASRNLVQVSMNLTDFEVTPLDAVYAAILQQAGRRGVAIAGSEIVGLLPRRALETSAARLLQIENFTPESVIERRVEQTLRRAAPEV
ncbi:MAG: glutamate formimidoyltransferase [Acidobacteria bacterium]|nr:glutamate formimidoyltransferase [Acidobacteriota bacterium]